MPMWDNEARKEFDYFVDMAAKAEGELINRGTDFLAGEDEADV
jgi:hypothetical protein